MVGLDNNVLVLYGATPQELKAKDGKNVKAGFVDVLIAQMANAEGCSKTLSFDKMAVRDAGMTLLV